METPAQPRTVIYARQSKDLRGEAAAVTRQIDLCMAKIESANLGTTIDPIIDNDVSATNGKPRKGYLELLDLIQSGQVDTVVAYHLDRLLRSLSEMEDLIKIAEATGVKIVTVAGDLDLSTDMGRLVGRILASVARGEVERKGRRQKDANVQAAALGKASSHPGFGHPRAYWVDKVRFEVPADQIQREAEAVREVYAGLFAGRTIKSMAAELNEAGFTTVRGNPWERTGVRHMLKNPANAGLRYLNGERIGEGDWEPIVSEETWQAAVQMLEEPERKTHASSARKWLGSGLYQCGRCNVSDVLSTYDRKNSRIYKCRATGHNARAAQKIDDYVLVTVCDRVRRDDIAELLLGREHGRSAPALRAEAHGLRERMNNLGTDYAEGILTKAQVRAATVGFQTRIDELEQQLAEIGRRSQLAALFTAEDRGQAFLDADLDVQRATVAAVCTVTVLPNPQGRFGVMEDTVLIKFREAAD